MYVCIVTIVFMSNFGISDQDVDILLIISDD